MGNIFQGSFGIINLDILRTFLEDLGTNTLGLLKNISRGAFSPLNADFFRIFLEGPSYHREVF